MSHSLLTQARRSVSLTVTYATVLMFAWFVVAAEVAPSGTHQASAHYNSR